MSTVAAIFLKDILLELRLRQVLPTMIVLAVVLVTVFGFFLQPAGEAQSPQLAAAVAWMAVTFAALLAAERAFAAERESRTLAALLAAPIAPAALFLAKCAFVLMLIVGVQLLVVPLTMVLFRQSIQGPPGSPVWLLTTTLLADVSLALIATASAALVAEARIRGPLLSVIALPLLVPVLLIVTTIFSELAGPGFSPRAAALTGALAMFNLAFLTAALLLFPHIMEP